MSTRRTCPDCQIPMDAATAVIGRIGQTRAAVCTSCAEDRGWVVPQPRRSLSERLAEVAEQGVAAAEQHASSQQDGAHQRG